MSSRQKVMWNWGDVSQEMSGFFWGVCRFRLEKKSACVKRRDGYAAGIISFKVRLIFSAFKQPKRRRKCQSSGAVWKSRWTSWAPVPNKPAGCVDVKQHFNQRRKLEALMLLKPRKAATGENTNICTDRLGPAKTTPYSRKFGFTYTDHNQHRQ